jgi:hypothetical protein
MASGASQLGRHPGRGPLLDRGTKLGSGWRGRVFPQVGEAVAVPNTDPQKRESRGGCTPEENIRRAARRARTQVRRYCVANRLFRMWTLTYGADKGPRATTHDQVVNDLGNFVRQLRKSFPGAPKFAYVWVPELHKDGVHYHVHFLVDRFIPHSVMEKAWGHGWVGVPKGKDRHGQQIRGKGATRRAAGYASKYVGKAYEDRSAGRHRYECAQGFQPVSLEIRAEQLTSFLGIASAWFGGQVPSWTWSSSSNPAWTGPPVHLWGWDGEGEEVNVSHGRRTELVGAGV